MRTMIAIDPGLHSCGWAVFDPRIKAPMAAGLVKPDRDLADTHVLRRAVSVGHGLLPIVRRFDVLEAWIEFPVFYANSAGGHMAAATGDLLKLVACVGAIAGVLEEAVVPEPVLVPEWKGQLPKPVVAGRIRGILGDATCDRLGLKADMWDAVGIGLYKKGLFK